MFVVGTFTRDVSEKGSSGWEKGLWSEKITWNLHFSRRLDCGWEFIDSFRWIAQELLIESMIQFSNQ